MRKVYLPVYLIEWSDVRPYALLAARGIRIGSIYLWQGLCQLAVWTGVGLVALWKVLLLLIRLLIRATKAICRGVWRGLLNVFTITNPRGEDEEDEEDEEEHDTTKAPRRTIFDED